MVRIVDLEELDLRAEIVSLSRRTAYKLKVLK